MNNNLQTINRIYEAFGKGDIPTIIDFLSENVQWEQWADNSAQKANVPWLLSRKGHEGAIDFFKSLANLEILDFQVLSIMSNDMQGKVTRLRHYIDTAKHIAAAKTKN